MGADSSKGAAPRKSAFMLSEREELDKVFRQICGDGTDACTLEQFKVFVRPKLPEDVCIRLFAYMKHHEADVGGDGRGKKSPQKHEHVTKTLFEASMGHIVKGSSETKAKLLMHLLQDANIKALKPLLDCFLHLAELSLSATAEYKSWKPHARFSDAQFVNHYLFDLIYKDGKQQCDVAGGISPESAFTIDDVERWLAKMPVISQIMDLAFRECFPVVDMTDLKHLLPKCDAGGQKDPMTALDLTSIIFINNALPHHLRTEWRLLYNATLHGASFATVLKRIIDEGPTILVIKDRAGHIFGGFASEAWLPHANFYGSSYCFLFSILPLMDVFTPTGYNTNFMYMNHNQQTLPNGLGMGGQWSYAGLWLDEDYGHGHSKAKPKCTTYNSPQLSSKPDFTFDLMEVWAVGPKPRGPGDDDDPAEQNPKKKSGVLNIDPEAKALLDMIGKQQHSADIREADAKEDEKKPK